MLPMMEPGDGSLHHPEKPLLQRYQGDDQLGRVSKCGVQQASDPLPHLLRQVFRGPAHQARQRNDGDVRRK